MAFICPLLFLTKHMTEFLISQMCILVLSLSLRLLVGTFAAFLDVLFCKYFSSLISCIVSILFFLVLDEMLASKDLLLYSLTFHNFKRREWCSGITQEIQPISWYFSTSWTSAIFQQATGLKLNLIPEYRCYSQCWKLSTRHCVYSVRVL